MNKTAANVIIAYISLDIITWTQAGKVTVNLGANFRGGLTSTFNNVAALNTSSSGNVWLNSFNVIPIQYQQLHAQLADPGKVSLSWSFESDEIINDVILERSTDGIHFINLFRKNYPNQSGRMLSFADATRDGSPANGYNYYRINMYTQNGNIRYSGVERVYIKRVLLVKILPNPVHTNSTMRIILSGAIPNSLVHFIILDMTGRRLRTETLLTNGSNLLSIKNMPAGTYLYQLVSDNELINGRFVVAGN